MLSRHVALAGSLSLMILTAAAIAAPSEATVELELRRITQEMLDAVAPGDSAVWRKYLDERLIRVDENGNVHTKSQLLEELAPLPEGLVGTMRIDQFHVEVHGHAAIAAFEIQEHLNFHGQPLHTRFRVTDTWLQTPQGWRLIGEHVSVELKDPQPIDLPSHQLCSYDGTYALTPDIKVTVHCKSNGIEAKRSDRAPAMYLPEFPDVFFVPGQPRTRRIFQRSASGAITGFVDRREGVDVRWTKSGAVANDLRLP